MNEPERLAARALIAAAKGARDLLDSLPRGTLPEGKVERQIDRMEGAIARVDALLDGAHRPIT